MDELWNPEPLLPRWLKIVSLILAGTAWVEFMVVPLLALYRGAPDVLLWILPVAWLLFYGAAFGIAVGMAFIARGGSWMDQQPAFIKWYFGFFVPGFVVRILNACYKIWPTIMLLTFPAFGNCMGILMVYLSFANTGQANIYQP